MTGTSAFTLIVNAYILKGNVDLRGQSVGLLLDSLASLVRLVRRGIRMVSRIVITECLYVYCCQLNFSPTLWGLDLLRCVYVDCTTLES